jgi:hypothetical protein
LPAVGAGYLAQEIGLLAAANVFGAALILLACAAIFLALAQRRLRLIAGWGRRA